MTRTRFLMTVCLLWLSCQLPIHPAHATTGCSYNFTTGSGNSYLNYCVTANGNIASIVTPFALEMIDNAYGEGYGICNESPAQNYTDYGVSDTGNWKPSILLNQTSTSVEIARTTSDGHWTLTQTITLSHPPSITVVMALKNNQSVQHVAYLVRFAAAQQGGGSYFYFAGNDEAVSLEILNQPSGAVGYYYGLLLQNVGTPPFGFSQAYVQTVSTGPNACAFAFNAATPGYSLGGAGSIEVAYVGPVPAGGTKTVRLTYRGY
jgi:hypothetical protein